MPKSSSPLQPEGFAHPSPLAEVFAIALGGALGACLRYAVALGSRAADQHVAWATATANVIGAFALGFVFRWLSESRGHPLLRPFMVVGLLGSFTTFSALAFDNRMLASNESELVATLHLAVSILSGLLAFAVGAMLGRGER